MIMRPLVLLRSRQVARFRCCWRTRSRHVRYSSANSRSVWQNCITRTSRATSAGYPKYSRKAWNLGECRDSQAGPRSLCLKHPLFPFPAHPSHLLHTRRCTTLSMAMRLAHWLRKWVRRARRAGVRSCLARLFRFSSAAQLRRSSCPKFSASTSKSTWKQ